MKSKPEFKFENLQIWQKAMDLGEAINTTSDNFPRKELFNLSSQICRAADAIAINISEGSIGQSNKEFKKSLAYAIRCLVEVMTCLHKAKRRKYITHDQFESYYDDSYNLMNMMLAFKNNIT